jgi:hypothetical protein
MHTTSKLRSTLALALGSAAATALVPAAAMATVDVTTSTNPATLANSILGSGISIVGTPSYSGAATQSGTFTGGTSAGIGIDEGLILTSGDATDAAGPNSADNTTTNTLTPGDADLDAQIGGTTFDAAALEFTFQFGDGSVGGDLFFDFVFASEEYNEFVGSTFNDPFALLIDGVNVAEAPDGQTVEINSVNCGDPFDPLTSTGTNCGAFNNNDLSDGGPFFDIEYDGFTDVFTAEVLGLSAGTHTAKFVVADAGDSAFDSAVFIAGQSFSDTPTDVPEPATLALVGAGLAGLAFARRRRQAA